MPLILQELFKRTQGKARRKYKKFLEIAIKILKIMYV